MKNNLILKINNVSVSELIKVLFNHNINTEIIESNKKYIICKISIDDLKKIKKLYKIEILNEYSFKNLLKILKTKIYYILLIIIAFLFYLVLTNIIVKIEIQSNNKELVKNLTKELELNNVKRLTFKKDYISINNIKENIINKFNDKIEWLEIENIGMTYVIKLEERKTKQKQENEGQCHIIANDDGMVKKIISNQGDILVKNNQIVKEGDILISGKIMLNDEIKANICAKGLVYAEKWYNVSIDMPNTIKKKRYTNKIRYNLLYSPDNRDFKIFKSRLENYDSEKNEIISILNKKLYSVKEYEYVYDNVKLDETELNKRIDELIFEKLELNLGDNERILSKNVLKKEENDSRIKIELFVTIEKLISKQVTYTLE